MAATAVIIAGAAAAATAAVAAIADGATVKSITAQQGYIFGLNTIIDNRGVESYNFSSQAAAMAISTVRASKTGTDIALEDSHPKSISRAVRGVASAIVENTDTLSSWEMVLEKGKSAAISALSTLSAKQLQQQQQQHRPQYQHQHQHNHHHHQLLQEKQQNTVHDITYEMENSGIENDSGSGGGVFSKNYSDSGSGSMALDFDSVHNLTPFGFLLNTTSSIIANSTYTTSAGDAISNASSFGNIAATETPYIPYVMRPETYIVPVLFAFIFIVGVLGNGTLIVVFLGVRQMRNVPNTYILSLALADLLVIVTTVPLTSTVYTVDSWPWGSFLCTFSEFIKDVSIGVSVFTLTALSGDRYFAIVDPLRKFHAHGGGRRATRMTIAIAISIWGLAIVCGMPALLGSYIKKIDINSSKSFSLCYPFPDEWGYEYAKLMVLLRFLVYYAIPLIIIAVFYVLIARHLMYSANVPGEMHGAVRQVRARRKVAVTVLAFVVIFGICFLPYHVFMLWFYYWPTAQDDYNYFWHVLRIVGFCLSFANSCANPVALYFVSGAFRKHFNRYLFCQGSGVRHKKRHPGDTLCMHRDTSLTSTASKRFASRRSLHHQSTIRSRLQETSITTMFPNGNPNVDGTDLALTNDYYQSSQQRDRRDEMRLM